MIRSPPGYTGQSVYIAINNHRLQRNRGCFRLTPVTFISRTTYVEARTPHVDDRSPRIIADGRRAS